MTGSAAAAVWSVSARAGPAGVPAAEPCAPATPLSPGCYGRRDGNVYQAGLTLAVRPSARWLLLGDYRFVASSGEAGGGAIHTHVGFLRIEARLR